MRNNNNGKKREGRMGGRKAGGKEVKEGSEGRKEGK
jgi:hypothetical protein